MFSRRRRRQMISPVVLGVVALGFLPSFPPGLFEGVLKCLEAVSPHSQENTSELGHSEGEFWLEVVASKRGR